MKTQICKPNKKSINQASDLLKAGEVVGVPTETVYGLAGDATNKYAIKKIFEAKGRPNDNPLIVHISSMDMLTGVVSFVSDDAKKLASVFWPGPLTMVMPKGDKICKETCAGLNSVGVRMPANDIAREIIEISGVPFAAPSANLSGKPSPTTAQDVYNDMYGKIELIIDGGECEAGIESTVVSMLNETPIILRPGIVTKEDIEQVLGKEVLVAKEVTEGVSSDSAVLSPGMKYKHYSPKADVIILKGDLDKFINFLEKNATSEDCAMCFDGEEKLIRIKSLTYGKADDAKSQAHNLFSSLRKCDELNVKRVFARCPETRGVSLAVYNRLIRSAGFKVIEL